MKNYWSLTTHTNQLRQGNNHYELLEKEELTGVRCIKGMYKSFGKSLGEPVAYTSHSFKAALDKVQADFRQDYALKIAKEYAGGPEAILSRYAQVLLDANGKLSAFTYGGSKITLLRHHTPLAWEEGITCLPGDVVAINLDGESSTQRLIESGNYEAVPNTYPLLVFRVEKKEGEALTESSGTVVPSRPETTIPDTDTKIPSGEERTAKHPSSKSKKSLGLLSLAILLSLGGWMGYPYLSGYYVARNPGVVPGNQDKTGGAGREAAGRSPFPKTDSLLAIYYGQSPRELAVLDEALHTLENEQNARTDDSFPGRHSDLVKEREVLVKGYRTTFSEYLSSAQLAVEEGKLSQAYEVLVKADAFYNNTLKPAIRDAAEQQAIKTDLMNRMKKVESLKAGGMGTF